MSKNLGIWETNKYKKLSKKPKCKPLIDTCPLCKKRKVKYHHFLCDICHVKQYGR